MIKAIIVCMVLAGVFFLTNHFIPSVWNSGPAFASYKGFQAPWAAFIMCGFAVLTLRLKSK